MSSVATLKHKIKRKKKKPGTTSGTCAPQKKTNFALLCSFSSLESQIRKGENAQSF